MQNPSSLLLSDLYQFTMAQGYWSEGKLDTEACFTLYFRENPFEGGFIVAAGLAQAAHIVRDFGFSTSDVAYLDSLTTATGEKLFDSAFLEYLSALECTCDIDAVPEGEIVFPKEPLLRVTGPIIMCQLLETPLLNAINFQSLVATKAARVTIAAEGAGVSEFGLRRSQGPNGGVSASRAAFVGGCGSTSNVMAGKLYGIPVAGTNAHSWVMAFDTEIEAFRAYARAMPQDCILLVDTYDTIKGVQNAITVGLEMRKAGHHLRGIRIDSGDLAWFSKRAREMLDEAGLEDVVIVASSDLDEYAIDALNKQGARVDIWGVGTRLATAYDQPALSGVYKLNAVREEGAAWTPRIKLSETVAKMTIPGVPETRRYRNADGTWAGDMICDSAAPEVARDVIVDPGDPTRKKDLTGLAFDRLLRPLFDGGAFVGEEEDARDAQRRCATRLEALDPSIKRFVKPYVYPVGLEQGLYERQAELIKGIRGI